MKSILSTDKAPAAIGPYSQAVWAGDLLFCSGQIPIDPATGTLVEGDAATQAERVLKNIRALLEAAGLGMAHVVKTTVFATDMGEFGAVNEVYARFFSDEPPARSFVQVAALPKGAKVEIEVVARKA
jgi:2-iminobutanoate/2-iminopropanoate deaminase